MFDVAQRAVKAAQQAAKKAGDFGARVLPEPAQQGLKKARTQVAVSAAQAATFASQKTGRGAGGMIGGLVAGLIDPSLMENLAGSRPTMIITGTNGKSTTTRMAAAAVRTKYSVCTNTGGDNMDAGIISALLAGRSASHIVLEVDELHVPNAADKLDASVLVLLNLSRDQLDRVGEINMIERRLRAAVATRPTMTIIANCDDVMVTSVAYDHPNVVWVSAGAGWVGDSTSCPRTESHIVRDGDDWYATKKLADGREFRRPTPDYTVDERGLIRHTDGHVWPFELKLPGRANRGNAAQAIAAAITMGIVPDDAVHAVSEVDSVAGRYSTVEYKGRRVHLLLAKNPAGWQEALSMVDRSADGLVIAVNGQVADGEDLSWLWDVRFEDFDNLDVVAAGERGTDLGVRLTYADITHTLVHDTLAAIEACPAGRVEVLANYTAFRDLKKALARATTTDDQTTPEEK
ncbi:MurT ligase domain-containing protein [Corynebacterium aquilae]|uniref:MurT ligase domain-containing protein n=1 Tax=Corynebacterium aquilae TaxID=203263 RepID=UPI000A01A16F|nr:MurT ligase domain-containing protein [Corynebacterium aquilae]